MAFLTLNGITIPTAKGGEVFYDEIGSRRERMINSAMSVRRDALKRMWRFTTRCGTQAEATALRALIQASGQRWPFDITTTSDNPIHPADGITGSGVYAGSSKGLYPSTANAVIKESNTASDGAPVYQLATSPGTRAPVAQFGSALYAGEARTNILDADERDAEGLASVYTSIGSTLSSDTTNRWQKSKSVKVVVGAGASGRGVATSFTGVTNGNPYSGHVYLRGDAGSEQLNVSLNNSPNKTTVPVTLDDSRWIRVDVTRTMDSSVCRLEVVTADASAATWYCDGFQLEAGAFGTAWADGARSAESSCKYPTSFFSALKSFTISLWTRGSWQAVGSGNNRYMFSMLNGAATLHERADFGVFAANGHPFIRVFYDGVGYTAAGTTVLAPAATGQAHHHVCGTYNHETGELAIYVDGTQEDTDTGLAGVEFSNVTNAALGSYPISSGYAFQGWLDDVMIIPGALSAAQVASLASYGSAPLGFPLLSAGGTAIGEAEVQVVGNVLRQPFLGTWESGAWVNNYQTVDFELMEV